MSKRGKVLKIIKAGFTEVLVGIKEGKDLPEEDQEWLFKKLDKFGDFFDKEMKKINSEPEDDLPF